MPFGVPSAAVLTHEAKLPAQKTPIDAAMLYAALAQKWPAVTGEPLAPRKALLLLLAQSALETGHWQVGIYNFNLGNIRHFAGDGYPYHTIRCTEYLGGKAVTGPCAFRAYPSLADAAYDYLSLLYRRYQPAWSSLLAGDAMGFSKKLRANKYYTEPESSYTSKLRSLYNFYDNALVEQPMSDGQVAIFERTGYEQTSGNNPPLAPREKWLTVFGLACLAYGTYSLSQYAIEAATRTTG